MMRFMSYRCTVVLGTPTMFTDLITIIKKRLPTDPLISQKISSLEVALTSGAYCTPQLFREMKEVLKFERIQVVLFLTKYYTRLVPSIKMCW